MAFKHTYELSLRLRLNEAGATVDLSRLPPWYIESLQVAFSHCPDDIFGSELAVSKQDARKWLDSIVRQIQGTGGQCLNVDSLSSEERKLWQLLKVDFDRSVGHMATGNKLINQLGNLLLEKGLTVNDDMGRFVLRIPQIVLFAVWVMQDTILEKGGVVYGSTSVARNRFSNAAPSLGIALTVPIDEHAKLQTVLFLTSLRNYGDMFQSFDLYSEFMSTGKISGPIDITSDFKLTPL